MDIKDYRNQIDNIDTNIGALLNERLNACREIGKLKKERAICNIYKKIFEEAKGLQK